MPQLPSTTTDLYPTNSILKPLETIESKSLQQYSWGAIIIWFQERLAIASFDKGRRLFSAKFLKLVEGFLMNDRLYAYGLYAAEKRKTIDHKVQVIIGKENILQATCSCEAGKSYNAACKHVAALCFCIEHYALSGTIVQSISKTSLPQTWSKPSQGRNAKTGTTFELLNISPPVIPPLHSSLDDLMNICIASGVQSAILYNRKANMNAYIIDHNYTRDPLACFNSH